MSAAIREPGKGLALALGAYLIWGTMPMYLVLMTGVAPIELIGWRILSSIVVAAIIVTVVRGWGAVRDAVRDRRTMLWLTFAGLAILVNWTCFATGALTGRILETSLGYFLNPILSIVLGVLVLRERLRPAQWVAVGISVVAVAALIVGYGSFPWIALLIACSFGTYGLLKKQVGSRVDAITGFTLETASTIPASIIMLVVSIALVGPTVAQVGPLAQWAVVGFGVFTAVPLMLFAAAARRVSLVTLGFSQYLAPILGFAFGAFVMHEPMPLERWIGFGLVWVSLAVLTIDMLVAERGRFRRGTRRGSPVPEPAP